ncbi:hypothetical protein D3C84_410740 [compost metagenome]
MLSHTLLSYLSALGAHRGEQPGEALNPVSEQAASQIAESLDCIAEGLAVRRPISIHRDEEEALAKALEQLPEDMDDRPRLVQTELGLICRQLGPLRTLAAHLLNEGKVA